MMVEKVIFLIWDESLDAIKKSKIPMAFKIGRLDSNLVVVSKQIRFKDLKIAIMNIMMILEKYVGLIFLISPLPCSLSLSYFSLKKNKSIIVDYVTKDIRCLLQQKKNRQAKKINESKVKNIFFLFYLFSFVFYSS